MTPICCIVVVVVFGALLAVPITFGAHQVKSETVTVARNSKLEMDISGAIYFKSIEVSLQPDQQDIGNIYVTTVEASDIHYRPKVYSIKNAMLNNIAIVRYWPRQYNAPYASINCSNYTTVNFKWTSIMHYDSVIDCKDRGPTQGYVVCDRNNPVWLDQTSQIINSKTEIDDTDDLIILIFCGDATDSIYVSELLPYVAPDTSFKILTKDVENYNNSVTLSIGTRHSKLFIISENTVGYEGITLQLKYHPKLVLVEWTSVVFSLPVLVAMFCFGVFLLIKLKCMKNNS